MSSSNQLSLYLFLSCLNTMRGLDRGIIFIYDPHNRFSYSIRLYNTSIPSFCYTCYRLYSINSLTSINPESMIESNKVCEHCNSDDIEFESIIV